MIMINAEPEDITELTIGEVREAVNIPMIGYMMMDVPLKYHLVVVVQKFRFRL